MRKSQNQLHSKSFAEVTDQKAAGSRTAPLVKHVAQVEFYSVVGFINRTQHAQIILQMMGNVVLSK
jgi:hypothetical protein